MQQNAVQKTVSEELFEEYLALNEYHDWDFEPMIDGQTKRPDYRLRAADSEFLVEVKELRAKRLHPSGAVCINPYSALRSEIDEARLKFKSLKSYCCSLLVYNVDDWEARLDPHTVFSAMLGDAGFAIAFDPRAGQLISGTERETFFDGGKMRPYRNAPPQNTTISTIIVLERFRVPDLRFERDFQRAVQRHEQNRQRQLTTEEYLGVRFEMYGTRPLQIREVPRLCVIENPFAARPLPDQLFKGPYDERWVLNSELDCIYAGPGLLEIEAAGVQ